MKKNEFFEKVAREVELRTNNPVTMQDVTKNNELVLHGLTINGSTNENVKPVIYLDNYYNMFESEEKNMDEIVTEIIDINDEACIPNFDMDSITNWEKVKNNIFPRVINASANAELLRTIPHEIVADGELAIYYCLLLDMNGSQGSVKISEEIMRTYNISERELKEAAYANLHKSSPVFRGLKDVISEITCGEQCSDDFRKDDLYVITNKEKNFGAIYGFDSFTM